LKPSQFSEATTLDPRGNFSDAKKWGKIGRQIGGHLRCFSDANFLEKNIPKTTQKLFKRF